MNTLPVIGITMGDLSGIGPEIILKALSDPKIYTLCKPIVIGDPGSLLRNFPQEQTIFINELSSPEEARGKFGIIDMVAISKLSPDLMIPGRPTPEGGRTMVKSILKTVELAQNKSIAAMVTCPINKALMNDVGYHYEGHTQLIAHLTNSDDYIMMLAGKWLKVTLVTIHCALKDVASSLDIDKIYRTIIITSKGLKHDFGIENPRIAVAALNPHAGESGMFGSEESEIIIPAVDKALGDGYDVTGPLPADTIYYKAASGSYDAVVSMYHDQALIPLKLLHFSDGVNITLGLPIVRTSVDHGTAYDIAGKGLADEASLKEAINMAIDMAHHRQKKIRPYENSNT